MHPAQRLYRLQKTDMSLAQVERRLGEIATALGESDELRSAKELVQSTTVALGRWQTMLRDRELEVRSVSSKIEASEDRTYSGRVRNPKELEGLEEELQSLKRRRAKKEDAILDAMLEIEQLTETLGAQEAALNLVSDEWGSAQETLLSEQRSLRAQWSDLQTARQKQASAPGVDLQLYEDLRRRRAGRPVSVLRDGRCQACGMALPTGEVQRVKHTSEICLCSSCGRALWAT